MKQNRFHVAAFALTFLVASSCFCSLQAQQLPRERIVSTSPVPEAKLLTLPQRILITVEVMEVNPEVLDHFDKETPDGVKKGVVILDSLYKDQMTTSVRITFQTPNGFPGSASYDKIICFSDKDHPGRNLYDAITSVEATPHVNGDYIQIHLKTMITKENSESFLTSTTRGMTLPLFQIRDGETAWFRGVSLNHAGKPADLSDNQAREQVTFVTANILPASGSSVTGGK